MESIVILSLVAVLLLFLGLYKKNKFLLPVAIIGLIGALIPICYSWYEDMYFYNYMLHFNTFSNAFSALLIVSTIFIFIISRNYFEKISENIAEYYAILLFALVGGITLCSFNNMAMLFMGVETLSISMYVMAGIRKKDLNSNEASLKYFLMGSFSTGFLLFGIALIYGATGSFNLEIIASKALVLVGFQQILMLIGILLIMVAMAFKVGAAPFHFWTPDVYEGSPSLVAAYMSTVVKTAAIVAFLRLFQTCFSALENWQTILSGIAVLTLFIGNITAVYQTSFKRMLAYSSISHAGYMLLAIVALGANAGQAIFFYAGAYSFASIIAFACLIKVKEVFGYDDFDSFNGLAKRNPLFAAALSISMLSMAGIPLTAGFFGKFYVFVNTISSGYIWLVVIAVLNAAIGMFYYLKVIIAMYMKDAKDTSRFELANNEKITLLFLSLITLIIGVFPNFFSF